MAIRIKHRDIFVGIIVLVAALSLGVYSYMHAANKTPRLIGVSPKPTYIPPPPPEPHYFTDIKKAQEKADFEIFEPGYIPVGYKLTRIYVSESGEEVTLHYEKIGRGFSISEELFGSEPKPDLLNLEVVYVNGEKGYFSAPGPYDLKWKHGNITFSITADLVGGKNTVESEILKIADSLYN